MLFALLASLGVCLILLPSLAMVGITMICVAQILIGVVGYCHFWDLKIDMTVAIELVMTIGFAIDNVAHICHAYMHAPWDNRNDNLVHALNQAGLPVILGDISTTVALV